MGNARNWITAARQHRGSILGCIAVAAAIFAGYGYYAYSQHLRTQAIAEIQAAIAEYDFTQASTRLQHCLREWPDDAQLHFLLAQVCRRQPDEDIAEAALHLERAAPHWPKLQIERESLLLDFQISGQPDRAEAALRQLFEQHPQDEKLILEGLVRGCLNNARIWAAHRWLSRWIDRYPDDWRAYRWRGALLDGMGEEPHLAAADYERVLQLHPSDDPVRLRLGLMLVGYGYNFETALGHFSSYRERHSEDVDALVGIARCYREMSRPREAKMLLEQALRANAGHPTALLTLALVASDLEQDELAWSSLERLVPHVARRDNTETVRAIQRGQLPPPQALGVRQAATVYHQAARVLRRLGREEKAKEYDTKLTQLAKEELGRTTER